MKYEIRLIHRNKYPGQLSFIIYSIGKGNHRHRLASGGGRKGEVMECIAWTISGTIGFSRFLEKC